MHPLDAIAVRSPCTVPWASMSGDERRRFCGACRTPVFDLSAMTREEAESFVSTTTDACVRFVRRADGTIATRDCTRGTRTVTAIALAGVALVGLGFAGRMLVDAAPTVPASLAHARERASSGMRHAIRGSRVEAALQAAGLLPTPPVPMMGEKLMGKIAFHPPTRSTP